MARWFRLYDEVVSDPKVQRLSGDKFKSWINLLCLASQHGGYLPSLEDMAFALRLPEQKVISLIGELCELKLLDTDESEMRARYSPHNWAGRQFKSDVSAERVKAHRKRLCNVTPPVTCNVTSTVTVTPPDTEQIQITESERKKDGAKAPVIDLFPKPENPPSEEKSYFDRAVQILGKSGRSIAAELKKHKGGVISDARSVLEAAAGKSEPKQYIYGAMKSPKSNLPTSWTYGDDYQ